MENHLISIDYLILNLQGNLQNYHEIQTDNGLEYIDEKTDNIFFMNEFAFELHERGTKNFQYRYTVFYKDVRFATLVACPYKNSVLAPDFAQLQIDNALFYTHRHDLKSMLQKFFSATGYTWKAINRLDIAKDKNDTGQYRKVYDDLIAGKILIAGRKKQVQVNTELQANFETHKGEFVLNGFSVGKRSSARYMRIYNKTLELSINPKQYISDYHKNQGLKDDVPVWRMEYQLNARFFDNLYKYKDLSENGDITPNLVTERVTWAIFDIENLIALFQLAEKNHFELRENTGKSQVNKENPVFLHCWDTIKKTYTDVKESIKKIPKIIERTSVVLKRLAKSLFREYYVNGQDISYVLGLNHLLNNNTVIDPETLQERPLNDWFEHKMPYYLSEFHEKESIKDTFDKELYIEHQTLAI